MALPQYGGYPSPAPAPVVSRPICWGKSFDETNRECRGCSFQTSCKEEVVRAASYSRPYYGTPEAQRAPMYAAAPIPAPVPAPVPVYTQPARASILPVVHQPSPMAMKPEQRSDLPAYGYGWVNDQLFYSIHTSPPVYRTQLPGETFVERAAKNVALSVFESLLGSLLLAARQIIWAPKRPVEKVIDVISEQK